MNPQVEASTIRAGTFFADSRFVVPDFQRNYSWTRDAQVADFWSDLSDAIGRGEYFLGLVILTEGETRTEVVDGQQRLVTLTILANALRLAATELNRKLVAESIRSDFLYSMDYETEVQVPRIELTDPADREDLLVLVEAPTSVALTLRADSAIHDAHAFLTEKLREDLSRGGGPALRVGQWAEFVSKQLTFAVFTHPDRGAAFRVYEVVNTRGKVLTPTELIKSHVIGSSDDAARSSAYKRWRAIETQLEDVAALDQLTTFVRHVVTLDRGYVIPRELYQEVTVAYKGAEGVDRLLDSLEKFLPPYLQMVDVAADVESSEVLTRAFAIADTLNVTRFRPILLAACATDRSDDLVPRILDIVVPGALTGLFGTGSIEAQFARAARRVHRDGDWDGELTRLGSLRPARAEFTLRLKRSLNKQQAHVVRSAYLQGTTLPTLDGFAHQIRPRNADDWPGFDADAYREVGGSVGNWVLTHTERRPQGSRTPEAVRTRLLSEKLEAEFESDTDIESWTADRVRAETDKVADAVTELWYGSE